MAKEQNLSLNPTKISGVCGRLMCCLKYEYADYIEMKKGMPKVGKRIITPEGEGKVVRQNVMEKRVVVALSDGREVEFGLLDLKENAAACHQCGDREAKAEQDLDRG
jgi:cell fate regulator YaaT (PSP1 superfamily)